MPRFVRTCLYGALSAGKDPTVYYSWSSKNHRYEWHIDYYKQTNRSRRLVTDSCQEFLDRLSAACPPGDKAKKNQLKKMAKPVDVPDDDDEDDEYDESEVEASDDDGNKKPKAVPLKKRSPGRDNRKAPHPAASTAKKAPPVASAKGNVQVNTPGNGQSSNERASAPPQSATKKAPHVGTRQH
jgi:hypothetical protein